MNKLLSMELKRAAKSPILWLGVIAVIAINVYGILLNGDRTQWLVKRGDTEVRTIDIEASRAVEDNPLFYHYVYTRGDK